MSDLYPDEFDRELELYDRGRILKSVQPDAWEIIYDTLHQLVEDVNTQHQDLLPGDPSVPASHAGVYVLNRVEKYFREAMEAAINGSENPSKEFLKQLIAVRDKLDVLKQQGEQ